MHVNHILYINIWLIVNIWNNDVYVMHEHAYVYLYNTLWHRYRLCDRHNSQVTDINSQPSLVWWNSIYSYSFWKAPVMEVSLVMGVPPQSSIWMGYSIVNPPLWGIPIYSIDLFKGKITGESHDLHRKIYGFRLSFSLKSTHWFTEKSIDSY